MSLSKSIILLLGLVTLIVCHPKGDEMRKMTFEADNGLIVFTPETFNHYVMQHPRPYDVVILFTLKRKCNICQRVLNEFTQVAESFRDANGFKPDMLTHKRAVFFGVLYFEQSMAPFYKKLKFPTYTNILYTTPQNIQIDDKGEPFIQYDEEYVISYKENSDKVYAQKMIEFANAKSQRKFPLKKDPVEFLCYFIMFLGFLFTGFYIYQNFKELLLSPKLWLVGSLTVFIICIGGIVYNILHGTRFAKFDRDGNIVEFIHSGQRAQYIGEGLLMSTLFVLGGTFFYSFNWIKNIKDYWHHKFAFLAIVIICASIYRVIISIYKLKAAWYRPGFYPENYVRGSLINDQGNSF